MIEMIQIKVSSAMARQRFHGCEPDYIRNVCKGACCRHSTRGAVVHVLPGEAARFAALGAAVTDRGLFVPVNRRCPFQGPENLCTVHEQKPFGCAASPFTVNHKNTLIIRNRYRLLKCYRDGDKPAYVAFFDALVAIFGLAASLEIAAHLDGGGGDITVSAPAEIIENLRLKNEASHA